MAVDKETADRANQHGDLCERLRYHALTDPVWRHGPDCVMAAELLETLVKGLLKIAREEVDNPYKFAQEILGVPGAVS